MKALSPALFMSGAMTLVRRTLHADDGSSDLPDSITSAAFVSHVGYWSHRLTDDSSHWPFAMDLDCDALARVADKRGVLHGIEPEEGEIFLRWSPSDDRFVSAGIVISAAFANTPEQGHHFRCDVIEGVATLVVERSPYKDRRVGRKATLAQWARRSTVYCYPWRGDRFISWVDLDGTDPSKVRRLPRHSALPFRSNASPWRKRSPH
jgi:hypothetical protein